jgi:hypothetical protein
MRTFELIHSLKKYTLLAVLLSCVPQLRAQWIAVVGAQSRDQARQALAFLPNEMWIHAGDNINFDRCYERTPHSYVPHSEPDPESILGGLPRLLQ